MVTSATKIPVSTAMETQVERSVQEYYGSVLQRSSDLKTSACCPVDSIPTYLKPLVANIASEIQQRFYGCGSPLPPALRGCTLLDLGCGTGRDCYLASQLVGEEGRVIGVDMTAEQLEVAQKHVSTQMERFGYRSANVSFHHGYIEDLNALGIADNSVDVVISNCVLNLSPAKDKVFAEILRVLKPGGELYFSDVFVDRRLEPELMQDPVLLGECLAGAMYVEDFRRLMARLGVADVRAVASSSIEIKDAEIAAKLGSARFSSKTIRVFKLSGLEDRCEDYGQFAAYRGGIAECPSVFTLDDHHRFERDRPLAVCGNTAAMLAETRFSQFFEVIGGRSQHFGLFDCAPQADESGPCC